MTPSFVKCPSTEAIESEAQMAGVVVWRCDCGVEYKAVFNSSSKGMAVRCATPTCKTRHIITGQVAQLFVQTLAEGPWRELILSEVIVESRAVSGQS
jgi:hypothetical protein